ncbi:hypothetical protein F0726_02410 [Acidithiobacillus caldus]|nr:hypothetical protein F0726_02410 [Acidithiobacillus caldus]
MPATAQAIADIEWTGTKGIGSIFMLSVNGLSSWMPVA